MISLVGIPDESHPFAGEALLPQECHEHCKYLRRKIIMPAKKHQSPEPSSAQARTTRRLAPQNAYRAVVGTRDSPFHSEISGPADEVALRGRSLLMWILGQERQEHWFSFVAHLLGDFWRFLEQACFGDSRKPTPPSMPKCRPSVSAFDTFRSWAAGLRRST